MHSYVVASCEKAELTELAPGVTGDADARGRAEHVLVGGSPYDFARPPSWFSYSTLYVFERCPRQYALRYLCGLSPAVRRPAMDFGTAAHAAFAKFTRERRVRMSRGEPAPDRAELGHYFETGRADAALGESWRGRSERMLDSFWKAESAGGAETLAEEAGFAFELPIDEETQVIIAGYIDRIDRRPSGGVEVIDYKTGPAGPAGSADSSLQLSIYALGCRDALGLGRPELVTLYYVEQDRRVSAERTGAALDALLGELRTRARRIRESDFAASPSPEACSWCDFAGLCDLASSRAEAVRRR